MSVLRSRTVFVGGVETRQYGYYRHLAYHSLVNDMYIKFRMPQEILNQIFETAGHIVWYNIVSRRSNESRTSLTPASHGQHTAATPPAEGSCPFIDKLPFEIRKIIFRDSLPSRNLTIDPTCDSAHDTTTTKCKRPNPLVNLMLINKKMCDEVAGIAYEERTFCIHVHQGFQNAGIEFLHVGRQPLHFLDNASDRRFTKFRPGDRFGFCRLKKIEIQIFPYEGAEHHTAINTYFMNIALVRLLERDPEKREDRITSLRIIFVEGQPRRQAGSGRSAIAAAESSSWWDPLNDCPRESSIHGISDLELALRPFANLSHVHQVDIQLPTRLRRHVGTTNFVVSLQRCMTAKTLNLNTVFDNDDLERHIESHRFGLEEIVIRNKYGGDASTHIPKLDDEEMKDAEVGSPDSDDDGGDDNGNDGGHDNDGHHDNDSVMNLPIRSRNGDNQQDNNERRSNITEMRSAFESFGGASFDENGGHPDDLDDLDDRMPVAPNATSEKVARFCEWFGVEGDVARRWLGRCGDDLSRASDLYTSSLDANGAASIPNAEGPAAPKTTSEKVASFCEWFGVDEDVARCWLCIGGYHLSRASDLYTANLDGDSAAPVSNLERPTASQGEGPHQTSLPFRGRRKQKRSVGVSNDSKVSLSSAKKGKEIAVAETNKTHDHQFSLLYTGRGEPSRFSGPSNDWKLNLSGLNPNKGKKSSVAEDDNMSQNGGCSEEDEEDDPSPRTPKMASLGQIGHNINNHSSTHRNRQRWRAERASAFSPNNSWNYFAAQNPQQSSSQENPSSSSQFTFRQPVPPINNLMSRRGNRSRFSERKDGYDVTTAYSHQNGTEQMLPTGGETDVDHLLEHSFPRLVRQAHDGINIHRHNGIHPGFSGRSASEITESRTYAPLDVPSDLSIGMRLPIRQRVTAARSSSTAQDNAQWAGTSYWGSVMDSTPVQASTPSSDVYAPTSSQTRAAEMSLIDLGGLAEDGSSLVAPGSYTATNNTSNSAFATPSRQFSLPNTHVNDMDVGGSEDSPPGGVALNPEQMQDSGFWQQSRHTYHGMLNFWRGEKTD